MSGKGDTPRNLGPKFLANYDSIFRKPRPKKTPTKRKCKPPLS